jgi:hypothetical protein
LQCTCRPLDPWMTLPFEASSFPKAGVRRGHSVSWRRRYSIVLCPFWLVMRNLDVGGCDCECTLFVACL